MATYKFATGRPSVAVTVWASGWGAPQAGAAGARGTQVASGTAGSDGLFSAVLTDGPDYIARFPVGDGEGAVSGVDAAAAGGGSSGGSPGSSSSTTATLARAAAGLRATFNRGYHSTGIAVIGDSTGDETDEWFGVLAQKIASAWPAYSVVWRQWNNTTSQFDPPSAFSAGSGNGGGARCVQLAAGNLKYTNSAGIAGDVEVVVKLQPTGGWAPGGSAASRTILSRYNASGTNRGFWFYLDETGHLKWTWSSSGSADAATLTSSAAVPFTTEAGWVRVTFDVDNGATGSDGKFYTSTDGITWTQLGSTQTTAGVTTIASTYDVQLGARNSTAADFLGGKFFYAQVYSGTLGGGGFPQVPYQPEFWDTGVGTATFVGAPVVTMLNGSQSGQNIAYFNESNRRIRLASLNGQQLLIVSDGHNEGNTSGYNWRVAYDVWIADLRNRSKYIPFVLLAQNPTLANVDTWKGRELRGAQIMSYASSAAGCYGLDIWPLFSTDQTVLGTQLEDNIHPGPTGTAIWAQEIFDRLGLGLASV